MVDVPVLHIVKEIMCVPQTRMFECIGEQGVDVPVLHVVKEIFERIMDIPQASILGSTQLRCWPHTS